MAASYAFCSIVRLSAASSFPHFIVYSFLSLHSLLDHSTTRSIFSSDVSWRHHTPVQRLSLKNFHFPSTPTPVESQTLVLKTSAYSPFLVGSFSFHSFTLVTNFRFVRHGAVALKSPTTKRCWDAHFSPRMTFTFVTCLLKFRLYRSLSEYLHLQTGM